MKLAIILFILTYLGIFIFSKYKHFIALGSAIIFIILGISPFGKSLGYIDFNVLLMIMGIMGTVNLFIDSKMPDKIAESIIKLTPNTKWMTIALAVFAGIVSAFIDNVATVLMIAPIALGIAKKAGVSPVPTLIVISIFSNLEGAATLVGDTTSILLAGAANMNFLDFFIYNNKMGLFFIVQISLILCVLVLYLLIRKESKKIESNSNIKISDKVPSILLVGTLISLIILSFFSNKPELSNGITCMVFYFIGLVRKSLKDKKHVKVFIDDIKKIDYETLLLLFSLFIIIGGIKEVGVIDLIGDLFLKISNNPFVIYTCIVFFSCFISAFIDNIPYVATMLPLVSILSSRIGMDPTILYYGLIIGATLGGNLTPVGASANITSIGILNKNGYQVKLKEYLKFSIPITLSAVLSGYFVVYLLYF